MEALRLAELLAGLSAIADLGMGLEQGEAARATLVAVALADEVGAPDPRDVYYTTLLQHIGCTAYAHEAAALLGGDEIAVKRAAVHTNFGDLGSVLSGYLPHLAPTANPLVRVRVAATAAVRAREIVEGYSRSNCEVAAHTAERLALGPGVVAGLTDIYEQWDGKGGARRLKGDRIALGARIAQVAVTAALFYRLGGREAALEALRRRSGASLDPSLVDAVSRRAETVLGALAVEDSVSAAVDVEPEPVVRVPSATLANVCRAFGEIVDLKTPLHHGHATGVAELVTGAAERCGLRGHELNDLRCAALVHDIGRAAIPNGVWERRGQLSWTDQERVRLHAYHGERVLTRCGPLARLAPLAGLHHERLDGTGYHRQATATGLPLAARLLAAADAFQAMTQLRAHRPAYSAEQAAELLATDARAGRLDVDATRAVIDAAGARSTRIPEVRVAGLTERQVEVLRLVARGLSNQQIADRLVVTRRTAEHHVQDVYARIGVASRAAAALYAMERDLLA